jgi:hypothetical protein
MRSLEEIAFDIRQITGLIVAPADEAILECTIKGTASGISTAFIEALDRADRSGRSSEVFHELLVEYANAAGALSGRVPAAVILRFSVGEVSLSTI